MYASSASQVSSSKTLASPSMSTVGKLSAITTIQPTAMDDMYDTGPALLRFGKPLIITNEVKIDDRIHEKQRVRTLTTFTLWEIWESTFRFSFKQKRKKLLREERNYYMVLESWVLAQVSRAFQSEKCAWSHLRLRIRGKYWKKFIHHGTGKSEIKHTGKGYEMMLQLCMTADILINFTDHDQFAHMSCCVPLLLP